MIHFIWVYNFVINTGGRGIGIRVSISMSQSRNLETQSGNYVGSECSSPILHQILSWEWRHSEKWNTITLSDHWPSRLQSTFNECSAHNFICRWGMWWEVTRWGPGLGMTADHGPDVEAPGADQCPVCDVVTCDLWHLMSRSRSRVFRWECPTPGGLLIIMMIMTPSQIIDVTHKCDCFFTTGMILVVEKYDYCGLFIVFWFDCRVTVSW